MRSRVVPALFLIAMVPAPRAVAQSLAGSDEVPAVAPLERGLATPERNPVGSGRVEAEVSSLTARGEWAVLLPGQQITTDRGAIDLGWPRLVLVSPSSTSADDARIERPVVGLVPRAGVMSPRLALGEIGRRGLDRTSDTATLLAIAALLFQDGEHEQAIVNLDRLLRLDPSDADAYFWRGLANAALGNWQRVVGDMSESIRLDPSKTEAYRYRGKAYAALKNDDRALLDYNEVLQREPDDAVTRKVRDGLRLARADSSAPNAGAQAVAPAKDAAVGAATPPADTRLSAALNDASVLEAFARAEDARARIAESRARAAEAEARAAQAQLSIRRSKAAPDIPPDAKPAADAKTDPKAQAQPAQGSGSPAGTAAGTVNVNVSCCTPATTTTPQDAKKAAPADGQAPKAGNAPNPQAAPAGQPAPAETKEAAKKSQ